MVVFPISHSTCLELLVVLFQVIGVLALCLSRLHSTVRWSERGKVGLIIALVGLGVAGALCGRNDSEFSLFAGLTMTALLIGMTVGGSAAPEEVPLRVASENS